ncbi:MAG TPA: GNAT family N-acetyltransferase [Candidatus Saccharibacteria bacterium]|nr:GNAT family N-acetyltransferase [Candidatus Saccharibacteria bacterium]
MLKIESFENFDQLNDSTFCLPPHGRSRATEAFELFDELHGSRYQYPDAIPQQRINMIYREHGNHNWWIARDTRSREVPLPGVAVVENITHIDRAYIHGLVVARERRDLSIGSQLLEAIEDYTKTELKLSVLALHAIVDTVPFYEKRGFEKTGTTSSSPKVPMVKYLH